MSERPTTKRSLADLSLGSAPPDSGAYRLGSVVSVKRQAKPSKRAKVQREQPQAAKGWNQPEGSQPASQGEQHPNSHPRSGDRQLVATLATSRRLRERRPRSRPSAPQS